MALEPLHAEDINHIPLDDFEDAFQADEQGEPAISNRGDSHVPHADDIYDFLAPFLRPEDIRHLRDTEEELLSASRHAAGSLADFDLRDDDDNALERLYQHIAGSSSHLVPQVHRNPIPFRAGLGGAYRDGGFGGVPAAAAAVADLDKKKYDGAGDDMNCGDAGTASTTCVVCIMDFLVGEDVAVMPCSERHMFHRDCLVDWLARSRMCPLCRHALPAEEQGGTKA